MTPLFSPCAPWATRTLLLIGLVCLPLTGLIVHEAFKHQQLGQQTVQAEQRYAEHQRILHQLQEAQLRRQRLSEQLETSPPVIRIMDSIGSVLSPNIALLNVDIDAARQEVRLTVNASSLDTLLAFSERLQKLPSNVVLESHQPSANNDSKWPLSASLNVRFGLEGYDASKK